MTKDDVCVCVQSFLSSVLSDSTSESEEPSDDVSSHSTTSTPQKTSIYTMPSPISFPRRISWPDSVPSPQGLPSIPPFPSPAAGSGLGHTESSAITLTLDQLHKLLDSSPPGLVRPELCVAGCSLLGSFLGSLSLLHQVTSKTQIMFMRCDRGVYSYRTENLIVTFSMEGGVLKGVLKPARGGLVIIAFIGISVVVFVC